MSNELHPDHALCASAMTLPLIPVCEHYAGSEQLIRKSFALQSERGADFDITCDCEDGASAGAEIEHVRMIVELIQSGENQFDRVGVRIHGPESPFWQAELECLLKGAGQRLAYLTIPKTRNVDALKNVVARVRELSSKVGRTSPVALHVLIESPQALYDVHRVAAIPEVEVLDFGLLDFISEHCGMLSSSCMKSPAQFEHQILARAKAEIVAAAACHGCIPSHNISLDLENPGNVFNDARRARCEFGFMRMWSIHPSQIQPIVEAMSFSETDLRRMEEIMLAGYLKNWAPIRFDDELHDRASYRYYWDSLCRARLSGTVLSAKFERAFF